MSNMSNIHIFPNVFSILMPLQQENLLKLQQQILHGISRSSRLEVFCRKAFLKFTQNSQVNAARSKTRKPRKPRKWRITNSANINKDKHKSEFDKIREEKTEKWRFSLVSGFLLWVLYPIAKTLKSWKFYETATILKYESVDVLQIT